MVRVVERSSRAFAWSVGLAAALASGEARATGFAPAPFEPTPAGDRFFAVPDARVPGVLDIHAATIATYAYRPLRRFDTTYPEAVTRQLYGHVSVSAAVAYALLLNVDTALLLSQAGDRDVRLVRGGGASAGPSMGDTRLLLRLSPSGRARDRSSWAAEVVTWLPTGQEGAFSGDGTARVLPRLAVSGQYKRLSYAFGSGVLFQKETDLGVVHTGTSLAVTGAAGIELANQAALLSLETYGHTAFRSFFGVGSTPWETLLGIKVRAGDFLAGVAFGTAPQHPLETFRAVLSLTWSIDRRVTDRDGDGLADALDPCPDVAGLDHGCPSPDRDGDSIVDTEDACPNEPGLVHADPRKNGCPPSPAPEGQ